MAREMKDSGIEWIGEIPAEWEIRPIKSSFYIFSGATPKSENPDFWDGDITWITPADFKTEDKFVSYGKRNLTQVGYDSCGTTIVPKGSIVFSKRAPIGTVAITKGSLCTNQGCLSCVPKSHINVEFFYYVMAVYSDVFNLYGTGTTFKEISYQSFSDFRLPYPSHDEQHRIASFLDTECARIDAVIEQTRASIEEYKKLKQAVITQAVTKGIRPGREMKDSGVEWIGSIPTEWKCTTIGRIATVVRGASPRPAGDPRFFNGSYIPWITVSEVTNGYGKYITSTATFLTEEGSNRSRIVEKGTLLLSNSGATLGVPRITKIRGCINDGSIAFYDLDIEQDYLLYVLAGRTMELRKQMQGYGQPNLNTTIVKGLYIPIPSKEEQIEIVCYLDQKTADIDKLMIKKEMFISEIEVYKKGIIYEYVTGKKEVPA